MEDTKLQDYTWTKRVIAAKTWPELLTALLYHDMYLIRPFSKIREHPCWIPFLQLLNQNKAEAVARLIGYLENYDVLGQWSLILLPGLTGENPVPESHKDELLLELSDWPEWAKQKRITAIL